MSEYRIPAGLPGRRPAWLLALAIILAAAMLALTGCHAGWPCDNHGGVRWTNGKLYECNDGTWE
jgi:hypothetical protein